MEINLNFLEKIPEECLTSIFSFLAQKDLGTAARVCKLWERVSSDDMSWKNHSSSEIIKLEGINLKEKLKSAHDKISHVIQNKEAKIYLFTQPRKIFSDELITSITDPQKEVKEKLNLINNFLENKIKEIKNLLTLAILDILYPEDYVSLEILLKAGLNPNNIQYRSQSFGSPLIAAAYYEDASAIELLLRYGADPSLENSQKKTALDVLGTYYKSDPEKVKRIKNLLCHTVSKK